MQASVGRSIVDIYLVVHLVHVGTSSAISNPSVGKENIHDVANILLILWYHECTSWLGDDTGGIVERGHIHI